MAELISVAPAAVAAEAERGRDGTGEFEEFVRARTPALLRAAYLLTGDRYLAEDLVQDALARTHLAWSRLIDVGNAEAYARKTMYHRQVSRWRRRRLPEVPGVALDETLPDPSAGVDAVAVRVTVWEALLRLTPHQRAVLVLRYYEDRTEAETAALLGCSVGTVKSQTARALARLRRLAPDLAAPSGAEEGR